MIASLVLACSILQSRSQGKPPDPALIDELIRKTNDLRGFLAEYKASDDSESHTIRIAYRAPDEFRFEMEGMMLAGRGGVVDVRLAAPDAKPAWARVSMAEKSEERARALSEAIETEFGAGAASWKLSAECGPLLEMRLKPIDGGQRDQFDVSMSYLCPRGPVLGWLETIQRSTHWTAEGDDHLVLRSPRGSEISVSGRTGFVEWMRRKDERGSASVELASLDLAPKFEHGEFELPEPAPEAQDVSEAFGRQSGQVLTVAFGKKAYDWIAEQVAAGKLGWDAGAREHTRRVVNALLAVEIASDSRRWTDNTRTWIEGLGKWIGECRRAASSGGAALPDEVEARIHESREKMLETIRSAEGSRLNGSLLVSDKVSDSKLRKDLEDIADEAWTKTFARIVHDPLVNAFDDTVERAKSGG